MTASSWSLLREKSPSPLWNFMAEMLCLPPMVEWEGVRSGNSSHPAILCLTLRDPMDCSPPGSSVYRIFQARILEWIAIPFFRGSSPPRDRTHISCISCIGRWVLYHWCHLGSMCLSRGLYQRTGAEAQKCALNYLWLHQKPDYFLTVTRARELPLFQWKHFG